MGMSHEQNRVDRDDHQLTLWLNIVEEYKPQFEQNDDDTFGLPYDYESIMHYGTRVSRSR